MMNTYLSFYFIFSVSLIFLLSHSMHIYELYIYDDDDKFREYY